MYVKIKKPIFEINIRNIPVAIAEIKNPPTEKSTGMFRKPQDFINECQTIDEENKYVVVFKDSGDRLNTRGNLSHCKKDVLALIETHERWECKIAMKNKREELLKLVA